MSTEVNKAVVERYADILTRHELAALDELFHADYVQEGLPELVGPGIEGLRQFIATWIGAFPDLRFTVEEQIGEDDEVWSRSTWRGTHKGTYLGVPATGKNVTVVVWTINRFVDGKIAHSRVFLDRL